MKLLAVIDDEWAARIVHELHEVGAPVTGVMVTGGAERIWSATRTAAALPRLSHTDDHDAALVFGAVAAPAGLARYVVTAVAADGRNTTDPVHWALRIGAASVVLTVELTTDAEAPPRLFPARPVDLAGLAYAEAVRAVARALATILTEGNASQPSTPTATRGILPVCPSTLRVDWTATARQVDLLVRSCAGRTAQAWTYLNRFPVTIAAAEVVDTDGRHVAPGTVLDRDGDRLTVQTGSGTVAVTGVRDAVGELPPAILRPGERFGVDTEEEIRELRGRVADLERTLDWLVKRLGADV